jgi:hypothetical protein
MGVLSDHVPKRRSDSGLTRASVEASEVAPDVPAFERQTSPERRGGEIRRRQTLVHNLDDSDAREHRLVTHGCLRSPMPVTLRGTELRYALTLFLAQNGPKTVKELIDGLVHQGFAVEGRPSKTISDALRWEVRLGRVFHKGRGRYAPGWAPRSTEYRIHKRVTELRIQARGADVVIRPWDWK